MTSITEESPTNFTDTNPKFSVRVVVCDHYTTKPVPGLDVIYSEFRGSDIKQVPVLRVFGSTPDGKKACLHIHGVFPYFYLPCPTPNPEPRLLYQIAASLDKAINIAMKQATSVTQHVYKISLVKGLPFYGFHDKEHLFLKIFLYNPGLIKQAVELCSNGAISGQVLQPHESHLNFTLQFFIDFNLFGMSSIDLHQVIFRKDGMSQKSDDILSPETLGLKPESVCYYEADCVASHIINRQRVGNGEGIENPGLEEVWKQESERRKQLNVSMASKSLSQGRLKSEETDSHYKHESLFNLKISQLIEKPVEILDTDTIATDIVHYPAETQEGSQILNATDISTHVSEHMLNSSVTPSFPKRIINQSHNTSESLDNTVVDEDIALNSSFSLQYSQILLDNEDLELVDMLQHLDERPIEDDSIMGTQRREESDEELDDVEYSHIYNDDTIVLERGNEDNDESEDLTSWDDSFWEGANIPQLDGACDDDHVKKVRKRKMRPFKLGLSRPKAKKNKTEKIINDQLSSSPVNNAECGCEEKESTITVNKEDGWSSSIDDNDDDEINVSREIDIDSISSCHIRAKSVSQSQCSNESISILHHVAQSITQKDNSEDPDSKIKIKEENIGIGKDKLVNRLENFEHIENNINFKNIEPVAGPSRPYNREINKTYFNILSDSDSSPDENEVGIKSFYDTSKIFDITDTDLTDESIAHNFSSNEKHSVHVKEELNTTMNTCNYNHSMSLSNSNTCISEMKIEPPTMSTLKVITPKIKPPSKMDVLNTIEKYSIPKTRNPEPHFSNYKDVGDKVELGHVTLKVKSKFAQDQKPFERVHNTTTIEEWRHLLFLQTNDISEENSKAIDLQQVLASNRSCILTPVKRAPTTAEVTEWLEQRNEANDNKSHTDETECKIVEEIDNSQAIGLNETEINNSLSLESSKKDINDLNTTMQVTMQPDGSFLCFGSSENTNRNTCTPILEMDFLTIMILEVHTDVRGDLNPDPARDQIKALFVTVFNDCPSDHTLQRYITQVFVADTKDGFKQFDRCTFRYDISYFNTEHEILEKLVDFVKIHDPDIMCGYEIEMNSWGYAVERSQMLGMEMVRELSRITDKNRQKRWRHDDKELEGRVIGRITFNVWRLFRYELALSSYSFENCMYEILKERVPTYNHAQLAEWWDHESRMFRWIPMEHYLTRLSGTLRMLEKLDIINRTSELARLFGLQWWEVLSRGSQFRVESLMLRAARPLNLVALSPTVKQRAAMRAPECLPLIFEPESRFYTDPVIVLDFQSLYPSMMIAYNYCFSTCVGRVQNINGDAPYEFGAWKLRIPKAKLQALGKNGLIHWSPVGVGFVKPSVRRGVLPALLRRILAARQAVKKGMKLQTDENVKKAMHSRQLGLKLIANVTYGYTAANFSGRMPCVEVGDSVVAKGRETLERAIKLVASGRWNAKVVYGDTDSMFVLVPGGTRADAFAIGQDIADAVTADNPSPVALKLEKVYQPCILQTKKRYVGYMYESVDQPHPVYEAKGIETVRRDGCPAGVKLLQSALCELFSTGDASRVKRLVQAALGGLETAAPLDLVFTREYHGPTGYRPGAAAPPNEIAKRLVSRDGRAAPRSGWRVRWTVCAGAPGEPLVRLARTPAELLRDRGLRPHVTYYAARALLPPLHRCLSLLGLDVFKWWNEIGCNREAQSERVCGGGGIARYMRRGRCVLCGARGWRALCDSCASTPMQTAAALAARGARARALLQYCYTICQSCCGHRQYQQCENTECPVLWRRVSAREKLDQLQDILMNLPNSYNRESLEF
ncbi:DNA polymerase zeta catalytic subunit [Aricia agestis]|uniref:DNA polymerase zeta catalytic subunit n=1 Tax=Aricia agestis TaxID=91739 RepID=UPI001C2072E4|nr:DNA polymerase zeta catalytic subunit [Aricia agestis]